MSAALHNQRYRNRYRPHHVTGRSGYPSTVNYRRETPEPEPPTQPSNSSPVRGIYSDHRTAVMLCSFMGTQTTVKTRNGSTYKGHTIGFSDEGDIAMSDVRLDNNDNTHNSFVPGIIIPKDKFVVCKTNGVDLKGLCSLSSDFTDSEIVSRINGSCDTAMKELQPWEDDEAPDTNPSLSLDDPTEGWDSGLMFQANIDKFNLRSTYNEELPEYTTRLPDPHSEGYEEKEKFAQRQAEAIEQSESYQSRIAKELKDGDEEFLYSAVLRADESKAQPPRHQESNSNSRRNSSTLPAQKEDSEQSLRNDAFRMQGRGTLQPASHPQQSQHSHHQQVARQMNNQFQSPPPSGGPLSRNQGPSSLHPRQQGHQNHAVPPHPHHQQHPPHHYQQQPPPPHPGMQQHILPVSHRHQQQQRSSPHQQLVPLNQHSSKSHPPPLHPQNVPSTLSPSPSFSSLSQQVQHQPPQKLNLHHKQPSIQQSPSIKGTNIAGPPGLSPPTQEATRLVSLQTSLEFKNSADITSQQTSQIDSQQLYQQKHAAVGPPLVPSSTSGQNVSEVQLPASPSANSQIDTQQMGQQHSSGSTSSSQSALVSDRRVGRGMETSPEERNKIGQSLHDFKKNFVLESNVGSVQEALRQDDTTESTPVSTSATSSASTTPMTSASETSSQFLEQMTEGSDRLDETPPPKYILNPNAKEFKPKTHPVQIEAQSPSPQPRTSPHMPQMVHYSPQQTVLVPYSYFMANSQRKRATVSLGAGVVSDLAAHQVTGQPLLATQPPNMMYLQAAGQALPTAYQLYSPQLINHPRMVGPGSLTMAQAGQVAGIEQMAAQNQPQPVFMTTQQQPLHTPIPAHLHHQAVHAQAIPLQPSNQQAQPAHMPNPVPSPVQHQQQNSQPMPQPLPHHLSQGPPQSSTTPQPVHYPQMTVNYTHGLSAVPRTSMSGQQGLTAGHSPVSFISASQFAYNGSTGQYTFAPALQQQASQNSSHGPGPQPQYVIMPQPNTQGHPPIHQHTVQSYSASAGIPFQQQHHLMQGPPHMPPNQNPNPSQSSPHLMHPGMSAGIHQQVSSTQPNMYMQVPSPLQQYQHQQ